MIKKFLNAMYGEAGVRVGGILNPHVGAAPVQPGPNAPAPAPMHSDGGSGSSGGGSWGGGSHGSWGGWGGWGRRGRGRSVIFVQPYIYPYAFRRPYRYTAPNDAFANQFPAINSLYEPLRTDILTGIDSLLSSFVNGDQRDSEAVAIYIQQTNILRRAGWYGPMASSFKYRSPAHTDNVIREIQSLAAQVRATRSGTRAWMGPMPRGSVGTRQNFYY